MAGRKGSDAGQLEQRQQQQWTTVTYWRGQEQQQQLSGHCHKRQRMSSEEQLPYQSAAQGALAE